MMDTSYAKLQGLLREAATLSSVGNLLSWDQETMMPRKGVEARAEKMALIGKLAHERATDPRIGELLEACDADPDLRADALEAANLREIRRDYDRALKLPPDLVGEIHHTGALAVEAWKGAREESDFARFRPWLEKQLALNRRKADCYGAPEGGEPYDALLEDFEPGTTGAALERIFAPLREELTPLIQELTEASHRPSQDPHALEVPIERQQEFNRFVLQRVGFDLEAGRLDVSVHPFSSGVSPGDTRITTRYRPAQFAEALSSTLHEAGHALYEQGLPKPQRWGQPLGEPLGLGIHESQSRLWENQVGRSREFWIWALPEARRVLGAALEWFSVDDLFGAVNTVRPNLIRVESDEATYNLHIMLRFDLERAMLRGDLAVADLPGAWNERIRRDLGLDVPDDRRGCLQDIHWAMGTIGYFPTYTLGNLYASQFWETIRVELPDLDAQIARGEFGALLGWLREKIHARGRSLPASELCLALTGEPLSHEPLMRHLRGKLRAIYGTAGSGAVSGD
jgi:carboxypeptidase Taq